MWKYLKCNWVLRTATYLAFRSSHFTFVFVPRAGLEPALPQWKQDFKSCVSTSSTTRALCKNEKKPSDI
jgi:hypothetical protein